MLIADAFLDRAPLVAITGQVNEALIGRDGFQEVDITGITLPVTKHNYIVLNSGPTFREAHDRTNSLQNPKLPDWAIIDLSVPPDGWSPGKIVAADFFDENWKVR